MKTTIILAATATAFLLTGAPTFAADTQGTQTQVKRCYRTVYKLPYRIRVACRTPSYMKTDSMRPEQQSAPAPQPAPEKKP